MRLLILSTAFLATLACADEQQEWPIRTDVVFYEAVVAGTPIKVVISEKAFDPTKHKTTEAENRGTEENPDWIGATVDGRPVIGTDQTLPPKGLPQLGRIVVHFGDRQVEVPESLTSNVFLPHLHEPAVFNLRDANSIVSISADGKCVQIDLGVGDGGGAGTAFFAVSADGKSTSQQPRRPEP
ncbi:MAG: hypothetical protein MUF31_14425 [Akkermansiaceae bacterium]|jgi:hypothetical protein|nr:hypothetical protein [Akkermansiaceae bacterium]